LIRGLLAKNPNHRIGSLKGIKEIISHPWLRGYQLNEKTHICLPPNAILNNFMGGSHKDNKKMK